MIKFGTIAAGAAILTPTLLTLGASPASASGYVYDQFGNASSTLATSKTLLYEGLVGRGILIATIAVAGTTAFNTLSSSTGNSWSLVPNTNVSGNGLSTGTYISTLDGDQTTADITVGWPTTTMRSVWVGTYFPNAITGVTDRTHKGAPSSTTLITAPSSLVVGTNASAVLYIAATLRTTNSSTPTYTAPDGFTAVSNPIYQTWSSANSVTSGVGASHVYQYPVNAISNFGEVSATLGTATYNTANLLAIY